jgi:starch synthase (maltosyl-transferring)
MTRGGPPFYVPEKTSYVFTIQAWVDHFDTWYDGFKKKVYANVNVEVEITEGILLLKHLSKEKNERLASAITALQGEYSSAIAYVLTEDFGKLVPWTFH